MDSGQWWPLVALAVALVAAVLAACAVALSARRSRRRLEAELAAAREGLAAVQKRLDGLARRVDRPAPKPPAADQEFVITTAGRPEAAPGAEVAAHSGGAVEPVSARQFASVALGESLVTIASFGYGVRRALSAENRNRIGFEMRREVRRARKQRRRDLREAKRHLRAQTIDDAEDAA
jgi:hypothetical protein